MLNQMIMFSWTIIEDFFKYSYQKKLNTPKDLNRECDQMLAVW